MFCWYFLSSTTALFLNGVLRLGKVLFRINFSLPIFVFPIQKGETPAQIPQLHSMSTYKLNSKFQPTGDQPQAIRKIVDGIRQGDPAQVLLGVTGSGKHLRWPMSSPNWIGPSLF
ncbi:MAG: hypothetical protein R2788_05085 [Saprospiraceae bacterium]